MLHTTNVLVLLGSNQRHHRARVAGPPGSTRTVHVIHMVRGWVEMDNAGQGVDMDASGHDVGRYEGVCFPLGERLQRPLALTLRAVTVHGDGAHAVGLQLPDDAVGPPLGAAEHEGLSVMLDQLCRDRHAFGPIHLPEVMGDIALRFLGRLDRDPDRVTLVGADDGLHLTTDGGREKEHLAVRRRLVEETAYRGEESHVRHTVRFVEHHRRDVVETHIAPLNQVFEASRARHNDVDALVQCAHLVAVAGATEDRDNPLVVMPQEATDDIVDLRGQLPRRHEDQRSRLTRPRLHGTDDERDAEGERLARAGRRLAADVPARQGGRNSLRLNGERFGDALAREALGIRRGDAKV